MTSKKRIQHMKSSQTLGLVSTSSGKGFAPFWTEYTEELSQRLWLPTKTGLRDMAQSSLSSSLNSITRGSWCSSTVKGLPKTTANSLTTCLPSPPSLWRDITEPGPDVGANTKKTLRVKKVRIYPTPSQTQKLNRWAGATRWTYNKCLDLIRDKPTDQKVTKKFLRSHVVTKMALSKTFPHILSTPEAIRDQAISDIIASRKSVYTNRQRGNTSGAWSTFNYRTKRDTHQMVRVPSRNWGIHSSGFFADIYHASKLKSRESLPRRLQCDSKILKDRLGRFFFCFPETVKPAHTSKAPDPSKHCTIALDPGVRTFMTGYDADGFVVEHGAGDISKIRNLCLSYDRLVSKMHGGATKHKQRCNMRKAALRIQRKIRTRIDDSHRRLSKWLCKNYRAVIIPTFGVSGMIKKKKRNIGSRTARAMCNWSHFRFRQTLMAKSREYPWCRVLETQEPYTSKTCGQCGQLNQKLGSKKTFVCPSCGYKGDRDVNATRMFLVALLHCE